MDHKRRTITVRSLAVALAVLLVSILTMVPALAGETVDADTFDTCAFVRDRGDEPSPKNAASARRQLRELDIKATSKLGEAFADAETRKERQQAFSRARRWCGRAGAYLLVEVELPATLEVVDATSVVVTGTATPGATLEAGGQTAVVGDDGAVAFEVTGLVEGPNRIVFTAEAPQRYPRSTTVAVNRTESEFAFKASSANIPYDELSKDPDALLGTRYTSRGEVFQYDARTGTESLLVSVTVTNPGRFEFWTDNVLLVLPDPALGVGIDQDDIIDVWGTVSGAFTYETAIGGSNTVPSVLVKYISLVEKR
jgi:hypothetical protein